MNQKARFQPIETDGGTDLTLSPKTFTDSTEAFINENSNSFGVNCSTTVGSSEEELVVADSSKIAIKKLRLKPTSPNRQGPQQCQICRKVFGNASALAKHKLTHSDERKYVCNMCGKAFKRQDHLNGHMLTHRNKKPYECKADGCGKSYCDARSLRRHTENHHSFIGVVGSTSSSTSTTTNTNNNSNIINNNLTHNTTTTIINNNTINNYNQNGSNNSSNTNSNTTPNNQNEGFQGSSDIDESSSSSIQNVRPIIEDIATTSSKVQSNGALQNSTCNVDFLLSTQPTSSNNNTLCKVSSCYSKPTVSTSTKPVECNLCHRTFKNIPALNGHMRLHGGYFKKAVSALGDIRIRIREYEYAQLCCRVVKIILRFKIGRVMKDSELKRFDKRESNAPPLQTVSVSVRALIEEKIIQKRISDSNNQGLSSLKSFGNNFTDKSRTVSSTTSKHLNLDESFSNKYKNGLIKRSISVMGDYSSRASSKICVNDDIDGNGFHSIPMCGIFQLDDKQDTLISNSMDFKKEEKDCDYQKVLQTSQELSTELGSYNKIQSGCGMASTYHSIHPVVNERTQVADNLYSSMISNSEALGTSLADELNSSTYSTSSNTCLTDSVNSPLVIQATSSSVPVQLPSQNIHSPMMPNSEDPLLSSSPKDFGSRKKFEFKTVKVMNNRSFDLSSGSLPSVRGILLNSNYELKLLQTSPINNNKKNTFKTGTLIVNPTKIQNASDLNDSYLMKAPSKDLSVATKSHYESSNIARLVDEVGKSKDALDLLSNPSDNISFRITNQKKVLSETNNIHNSYPMYKSRLRSAREGSMLPFTPPPMLPPSRYSQGLYWQAISLPSSTTHKDEALLEVEEAIQDSDDNPHINIGPQYQCTIPPCSTDTLDWQSSVDEYLLWSPKYNFKENEIDLYLELACCAVVPGGGQNKEYALHVLHSCGGKIQDAIVKLMQPAPQLPANHPLLGYKYTESDEWTSAEIEKFQQALLKYDKDFPVIAHEIGTKTAQECTQFYYLWKSVCVDGYKRIRLLRRKCREPESSLNSLDYEVPINDMDIVSTSSESRLFVCEYSDCSATFNSRAALNGHIRIHVGGTTMRYSHSTDKKISNLSQFVITETMEEFPCKICGKVFNKVKSRSAHMKSHRSFETEGRKIKTEVQTFDMSESLSRSTGVSSSVTLNRSIQ